MTTITHTDITPAYVQLNAENPQSLSEFYTESLGLSLIDSNDETETYKLGTSDQSLLIEIQKATEPTPSQKTAGLYHFAILVPKRSDLGEILRSLIINQVPMQGASDHGYSESLYLQDPEGNGIEIYWDKPRTDWTILGSGEIPGTTLPLDSEGVLAAAEKPFIQMPEGTKIGHYHISIPNLDVTESFYTENLGLGTKSTISGNAIFLASGNYHHHLGANIWFGTLLATRQKGQQGLGTLVWNANSADMEYIEEQLIEHDIPFQRDDHSLMVTDQNGITHTLLLKK